MSEAGPNPEHALWLSALLVSIGLILVITSIAAAAANAVRALRPESWAGRWARDNYITFAWQELGRGLYFGYLFALGLSPMIALVFLDRPNFWTNFFFGCGLLWGASAIIFYFCIIVPGLIGYAIHRGTSGLIGTWGLYAQIFAVVLLSAPFAALLWTVLWPPVNEVMGLLVETWQLYARVFT